MIKRSNKQMEQCVSDFSEYIKKIRTNLITPSLIENFIVNTPTSNSILKYCSIISTNGRSLIVQPYNINDVRVIEKELRVGHNLNTRIDDNIIYINFPPITEEYKKSLIKNIKKEAENTKIKIRNIRRNLIDSIKYGIIRTRSIEVQKITDINVKNIDEIVANKIKEINS